MMHVLVILQTAGAHNWEKAEFALNCNERNERQPKTRESRARTRASAKWRRTFRNFLTLLSFNTRLFVFIRGFQFHRGRGAAALAANKATKFVHSFNPGPMFWPDVSTGIH